MALIIADRVKVRSRSTGLGDFTLENTVDGFQSFEAIGDGNTTYYGITDVAGNWEIGIGTYTSAGPTLSRDTVISSSNSGNKVNWAVGSKNVFCTFPSSALQTVATGGFGSFEFVGSTISTVDSSEIFFGQPVTLQSNVYVGGDIVPNTNLGSDLGSPTNKFRHLYVGEGTIYLGDIKLSNVNGKLTAKKVINPGDEAEEEDPEDSDAVSEIRGGGGGSLGNFNAEGTELYADNGDTIQINTFDELDGEKRTGLVLDPDLPSANMFVNNNVSWSFTVGNDYASGAEWIDYPGGGRVSFTNISQALYDVVNNLGSHSSNGRRITFGEYDFNLGFYQLGGTVGVDAYADFATATGPDGDPVSVNGFTIHAIFQNRVLIDPDEGEIAIDGGTDLTVNVDGRDINLTATDDLRLTGSDIVALRNTSSEESIELVTRYGSGATEKAWQFTAAGNIILPQNGDIVDQDGNSVLGVVGGDNNIWIQTFVTDDPSADVVQGAVAVEYDDSNNIIALFSHFASTGNATYFSIAKFDSGGTRLWQYRYDDDFRTDGWGLAVDNNNGYIYVTGITQPETGGYSCGILSRLNTVDGSLGWTQKYDYGDSSTSAVVDVASDSNPVMVGYASNGIDTFVTVTKVSYVDGSTIWSKKLDGQYDDQAYGMAVGPSGEIVAVGWMDNLGILDTVATLSAGTNANWTVDVPTASVGGVTFGITFAAGVPTFTNIVDPTGARTQGATLGVITGDVLGGATPADDMTIIIDTVTAGDPYNKQLVVKYDSNGTVAWQKAIELDSGFDCSGADADIDSLGNIYVCGNYNYPGGSAMSIVKFDSSGAKQWSRRVSGNCNDFSNSIVVGPDDCLYLTAVTGVPSNSDFLLVLAKYNLDGTVAWQRLLDNTTTWTFTGAWWFEFGGGSSLAVRNGYVAVAGAFGDPGTQSLAMIAQVDTGGTLFAVDNWDYKGASFSGFLSADASDITVYTSNKTAGTVTPTVTSISLITDTTNFLVGTVYRFSGLSTGDVTFDGNKIIGTGDQYGGDGLNLAPGPGLDANMYFRIHGGDNPTHLHLSVGNTSVYDQYFGNDYKYLKLGLDGVISIGTNSNTWAFGTDGSTTFPTLTVPISDNATPTGTGQTLKFKDPTQQAIIYGPPSSADYTSAERVIIQGAPGYEDTTGEGGDIYLWAGPGGSAGGGGGDIKIRAGRGQVTGGGGYLNFQAGNTTSGYGGYINIESGSSNTANQGGNVTITANSGGQLQLYTEQNGNITLNTASGGNVWTLSSTGVTTLPGAVIKGTATKTYVLGTGIPTVLTDSGWMTALVDGAYGPFTGSLVGIVYTVNVAGGVAAYSIVSHTGVIANNTTIDQLDASALGGASGNLSNITVTAVNDTVALDLTKSVNKLADGSYTLADGVEGQIMYLVRQTATAGANVTVTVANGRVDGGGYTSIDYYPFNLGLDGTVDIATLIFTDGAWQAVGGSWN